MPPPIIIKMNIILNTKLNYRYYAKYKSKNCKYFFCLSWSFLG